MPYKIVNIEAKMKVGIVDPPICGTLTNKKMSYGDILKCLTMRAIVDEVMPDGSTVRLNMTNYHHDFLGEWEKKHGKRERVVITPPETKKVTPPTTEVKVDKKKDRPKKFNKSVETIEKVPETPAFVKAEDPVVETNDESADTPADIEPENKSSGFDRS